MLHDVPQLEMISTNVCGKHGLHMRHVLITPSILYSLASHPFLWDDRHSTKTILTHNKPQTQKCVHSLHKQQQFLYRGFNTRRYFCTVFLLVQYIGGMEKINLDVWNLTSFLFVQSTNVYIPVYALFYGLLGVAIFNP